MASTSSPTDELSSVMATLHEVAQRVHVLISNFPVVAVTVSEPGQGASGDSRPKINASGDAVLPVDEQADLVVEEVLKSNKLIAGFASEEREAFVPLNEGSGKYIVAFDPLDGSQNVPVGMNVGSIFGVFRARTLSEIKSGRDQVAAAYALYSSTLLFMSSMKKKPARLEQFISKSWTTLIAAHQTPERGKAYCINEGNEGNWSTDPVAYIAEFVAAMKAEKRSIRWCCCMVADVHRPLLQGGSFAYPEDKKYKSGRLRLVYEAWPMAYLWEACNPEGVAAARVRFEGSKIVGSDAILDVPMPEKGDVHARCGVILLGKHEKEVFGL